MAITEEQGKKLEELFKKKLQEQYQSGLKAGVLTVSKVVFDKLNDTSKPLMERIAAVKRFCEVPLKKNNSVNTTDETTSEENINND